MDPPHRQAILAALLLASALAPSPARSFQRASHPHHGASAPAAFPFPLQEAGDSQRSLRAPFPYSDDANKIGNWVASGDALRASDETGKDVVRITSSLRSQQGALANTIPAPAEGGFDVYFDFVISKGSGSPEAADGLAFWYTENLVHGGPVHGGSADFKGLAVIVDTYSNNRRKKHPYIYAWVNDGTPNWVDNRDGEGVEVTKGCNIDVDKPVRLFVQWRNNVLKVAASFHGHAQWFYCFTAENVHLPNTQGFFGFTASTGHFFATHDLAQAQIKTYATPHERYGDSRGDSFSADSRREPYQQRDPDTPDVGAGTYQHNQGADTRTASYGEREAPAADGHVDPPPPPPPPPPPRNERVDAPVPPAAGGYSGPASIDFVALDNNLAMQIDRLAADLLTALAQRDALRAGESGGGASGGSSGVLTESTMALLREVASNKNILGSSIEVGDDILRVADQMTALAEDVQDRTDELDDKVSVLYDVHHDLSELAQEFHDEVSQVENHSKKASSSKGSTLFALFVLLVQASVIGLVVFVIKPQSGGKSSRYGV